MPAPQGDALCPSRVRGAAGRDSRRALAAIWSELLKVDRRWAATTTSSIWAVTRCSQSTLIARMREQGLRADVRRSLQHTHAERVRRTSACGERGGGGSAQRNSSGLRAHHSRDASADSTHGRQQIATIVAQVPGGAPNVQDIYPLAPLQEGILFHHLLARQGDTYLLPSLFAFDSRERLDRYLAALQAVIGRHDILRHARSMGGIARAGAGGVAAGRAGDAGGRDLRSGRRDASCARGLIRRDTGWMCDSAPLQRAFVAFDRANGRWLLWLLSHHLVVDHTALETVFGEVQSHLLGKQARLKSRCRSATS